MGQDRRLEQRVKTLEYEMKILKNQIQRTLLDIQEQILIHYYPTLYPSIEAEKPSGARDAAPAADSIREKRGMLDEAFISPQIGKDALAEDPSQAVKKVVLEEDHPQVKKISLEEIKKIQGDNLASPELDHL